MKFRADNVPEQTSNHSQIPIRKQTHETGRTPDLATSLSKKCLLPIKFFTSYQ